MSSDDYCHRCRYPHDGSCTAARKTRREGFIQQLRAELATVRADQCPHGPRCADCKKARDHAQEEKA
jgi:hypothetical protein